MKRNCASNQICKSMDIEGSTLVSKNFPGRLRGHRGLQKRKCRFSHSCRLHLPSREPPAGCTCPPGCPQTTFQLPLLAAPALLGAPKRYFSCRGRHRGSILDARTVFPGYPEQRVCPCATNGPICTKAWFLLYRMHMRDSHRTHKSRRKIVV